jgi:hypothetical protein
VSEPAPDAPPLTPQTRAIVEEQLGRPPRAIRQIAHTCTCGLVDVIETSPRLPDGTPFPTLYYLTCPRASREIGRLEASGLMREMTERLKTDPALAQAYQRAADDYVGRRDALGVLPGAPTAGGMPKRVKCLHVLVAHSLAVGPGINPFGDEAHGLMPDWGRNGPCVDVAGRDIATLDSPEARE